MFFCNKKIKELEQKIEKLEDRQIDFIGRITELIGKLEDSSKRAYYWELREEEIELIEDGKKVRAIRKILE